MSKNNPEKNHDVNFGKNDLECTSPNTQPKDIFSSRKHSMDYVTVNGVIFRTGYHDKKDWYILCIKELLDNAIDFLWKNYQGSSDATITVHVTKGDSLLRVKVRNTNSQNVPVFQNLSAILDYDMRYGSKQSQHIISRGMLGDAMKQILSWPYVLIHTKNDGSAFTNKQWNDPLIIRNNGIERHVFLHVDKGSQIIHANIKQVDFQLPHTTDTEIELTWPVIDEVNLGIHEIEQFCKIYPVFTTDISFKFHLVDNSKDKPSNFSVANDVVYNTDNNNIATDLARTLTSPARKAAIKIDFSAIHHISKGWNNISSIHSYKPEEFVSAITSVHDKESTLVYDVLWTFREGSNMKKGPDNQISVAELMLDADRDKKIEALYYGLKNVLDAPKKISLPYANIKSEQRKYALVNRIEQLYLQNGIILDTKNAVYKEIHGCYNDDDLKKVWSHDGTTYPYEKGAGMLRYPFVFEIIAIPLNDDTIALHRDIGTKFHGSVNYSFSPRGNQFDGDYHWQDTKKSHGDYGLHSNSIVDILQTYGFRFYAHQDAKTKLPSVIVANLVSPRIDYHGHDKSRIDTEPFSSVIIEAAKKMAEGIQTFRAAGYVFSSDDRHRSFTAPEDRKKSAKEALKEFLNQRKKAVLGGGGE
jgi:hypothetical protein